MTVYISGPISGRPDNNKRAFLYAAARLRDITRRTRYCDIKIINPLTNIAKKLEKKFAAEGKEPQWSDYMRACIKKLAEADCAFFLNEWAMSDGASIERHIAKRIGIPCADSENELLKILGDLYGEPK